MISNRNLFSHRIGLATAIRLAIVAPIVALSPPVLADSVTYAYTATVTVATGSFAGDAGDTVSGLFTFNTGNATQSFPSVNYYHSASTTAGTLVPEVFTSTAVVNGVTVYSTDTVGNSNMATFYPPSSATFTAMEQTYTNTANSIYDYSNLNMIGPASTAADGLPVFSAQTQGGGVFYLGASSSQSPITNALDFTLTSLTPVPLPASVWLLVPGFVGLGWSVRRRKIAQV
jgi:hypothetical protein